MGQHKKKQTYAPWGKSTKTVLYHRLRLRVCPMVQNHIFTKRFILLNNTKKIKNKHFHRHSNLDPGDKSEGLAFNSCGKTKFFNFFNVVSK